MNIRLLFRLLGILAILIGAFMLLSLFWAHPRFGLRTDEASRLLQFESRGFFGLLYSFLISLGVGGLFLFVGRNATGTIFRKEAMAVVGLSWLLATVLGALPYLLSGTARGPAVRTFSETGDVLIASPQYRFWSSWDRTGDVTPDEFQVLKTLRDAGAKGLSESQIGDRVAFDSLKSRQPWNRLLFAPGESQKDLPADRVANYRLKWSRMSVFDALFESQSGFSTTGATVITDLEDSFLVPHCILFWRASTHFLGGLGIIVLFVGILGEGSAGKALMRTEMPGPSAESATSRMQHTAWRFGGIYLGLNAVLIVVYLFLGMSFFDSISHAFATMATGGFSTYNASLGHFATIDGLNGEAIEYVTILFMVLAGTNFTLLFLVLVGKPLILVGDSEFRTYLGIVFVATAAVILFGMALGDSGFGNFRDSFRNGLFQVVSVITTTGFGTNDFDSWNQFGRALMLVLMFVGGCAGSTGGGMKVVRHLVGVKILGMEVERAFQPKVVRLLRLGGKPVEDKNLKTNILVYFGLITFLFAASFLFITMIEPDTTWGVDNSTKIIDSASAAASTLNNIGPGLGIVGATKNYADFSGLSKLVFVVLMMLGRLELFPVLALFLPAFWNDP